MRQTRPELIALMRGQVACPLLANLAELGWLDEMSKRPFTVATFPSARADMLRAVFRYLAAIGLIEQWESSDSYRVSDLGLSIFRRYGSFCILNSYHQFFQDVRSLLSVENAKSTPVVDRGRNVFGSGQLHSKKFFLPALSMLTNRAFPFVVDLGCGNGQFLQEVIMAKLSTKFGGVDISAVALKAAAEKINTSVPFRMVEADASAVKVWSRNLRWYDEAGLFSLWFVLHEFSKGSPDVVQRFFIELNNRYPLAELIVGDLVRLPERELAINRTESIMPEFLFFHDLSGQGVLTWSQWQKVRGTIPFEVAVEHHLDNILMQGGTTLPSSFIWHLKPAQKRH